MDGVLTDSEPAFHAAVNDILARYGKHVSLGDYERFIGAQTPAMWTEMIAWQGLDVALEEILNAYEPVLMGRLRQPRAAISGARALVEKLRDAGVPYALCTASYSRWVDANLESAGLRDLFEIVSACEMVAATKPAPDPYLLAASKLGLAPGECVAIEDSVNGIASAVSAGLHVVQLRATGTAAPPQAGVAQVIASLGEFPLHLVA
jgi:HAD superfamily hydrolase (TIGR01509 family)